MTRLHTIGFAAVALLTNSVQAASTVSLIDEDFVGASFEKTGSLERDSTSWTAGTNSSWVYGSGNSWMFNTNSAGNTASESAVTKVVALDGLGLSSQNKLDLSFSYNAWQQVAGTGELDDLYVHVWGLVDLGTSAADSSVAGLSSTNGNVWGGNSGKFTRYNLKDGNELVNYSDSHAGTAAFKLTGIDSGGSNTLATFSQSIDLSGYGLDSVDQYDYLVIAFARDTVGASAPSSGRGFALQGVELSAVPEPSSAALLGLGGLALIMRRRK